MLTIDSLDAYYEQSHILRDVSLQVGSDQIVALLGRNGTGKTTTLRSIMGIAPPRTEGRIEFDGERIDARPSNDVFERGIAWVPEKRRIFSNLSVEENLKMGHGPDTTEDQLDRVFDLFPRLNERLDQRAGTMSGGEQQMLTIGRAMLSDPDLLLIDEPLEGLMPSLVADVEDVLAELGRDDVSILLAEQRIETTLELADHAYILEKGQIVHDGSADELLNDEATQERHLGVAMGEEA